MNPIVEREKPSPLNNVTTPNAFNRITAALVDFVFFMLVAYGIMFISFRFLTASGTMYQRANSLIDEHVASSKLAKYDEKKGYLTYDTDDYYVKEGDNCLIINRLSYYYLSYLTGENIDEGLIPSLNFDKTIVVDGESYLPKDYYTIKWFNENILSLGEDGTNNDFFAYQDSGSGPDLTKIGTINPSYFDEGEILPTPELNKAVNEIYIKKTISHFNAQDFIRHAHNDISLTSMIGLLISTIIPLSIFYIIIPMFSPFARTLGKMILHLSVISSSGYVIKKWQVALRPLLMLIMCVFVSLINNLQLAIITPVALALASLGFMLFSKNKQCIHDFLAKTLVIKSDGAIVYRDENEYNIALSLLKKKESEQKDNGK